MFSKSCFVSALVLVWACAMAPVVRAQTAAEGAAVYERRCASCHRPGSPVAAPSLPTAVTYPYRRFSDEVRNGRDRPAPLIDMPAFRRVSLADRDLCAIYLHVRAGRPEAAGDTAALCGLASPPPAPASAASSVGSGSATATTPAPPTDAALAASRPHFPRARNKTYRLECRGGNSAAAIMYPTASGSTDDGQPSLIRLGFQEWHADRTLQPAFCIWVGAVPPRGPSSGSRVDMEWHSYMVPPFTRFTYRAVDSTVRIDVDRSFYYPPLFRDLVEGVSRPDATFAFEVWYEATARPYPLGHFRVSAAAVRFGAR